MSQTSSPDPAAVPYAETADFEWTERAFEALGANELTATVGWAEGISSVQVEGPCPRCAHHLVDRQVKVVVVGLSGVSGRPIGRRLIGRRLWHSAVRPKVVEADVTCGCGIVHEGAPEAVTGCGVSFRIELSEDGS